MSVSPFSFFRICTNHLVISMSQSNRDNYANIKLGTAKKPAYKFRATTNIYIYIAGVDCFMDIHAFTLQMQPRRYYSRQQILNTLLVKIVARLFL